MSKDLFERWDAGPDPDYEKRSDLIIKELSGRVPWSGTPQEFEAGVRALIDEVRKRPTLEARAQIVGAFRWWGAQPVGNDAWRARVTEVMERLSREFLERHA